jgi:hypothetical protein
MSNKVQTYSSVPQKMESQLDYIVLDGSGSMFMKWQETLQAIDAYVDTLYGSKIATHIKLVQFSSPQIEQLERDGSITDWWPTAGGMESLSMLGGGTQLYDAINRMGLRLRELDPPKCAITIATDGEDRDSKVSVDQARAVLDWCRAKGWQVTFIGCDFNNEKQGRALGASPQNTIGVQKKLLSEAARSLGRKRARYAVTGDDINFTEDERQQFGGYLAAPKKD